MRDGQMIDADFVRVDPGGRGQGVTQREIQPPQTRCFHLAICLSVTPCAVARGLAPATERHAIPLCQRTGASTSSAPVRRPVSAQVSLVTANAVFASRPDAGASQQCGRSTNVLCNSPAV